MLSGITSGSAGAVQSHAYTYDLLGKLLTRSDANTALSRELRLRRAEPADLGDGVRCRPRPLVKTFAYNAIGNLTAKSDVGTYTYPAAGQPRPHARHRPSAAARINTTLHLRPQRQPDRGARPYHHLDSPTNMPANHHAGHPYGQLPARYRASAHQAVVAPDGTTLYIHAFGVICRELFGIGSRRATCWNEYLTRSAMSGSACGSRNSPQRPSPYATSTLTTSARSRSSPTRAAWWSSA